MEILFNLIVALSLVAGVASQNRRIVSAGSSTRSSTGDVRNSILQRAPGVLRLPGTSQTRRLSGRQGRGMAISIGSRPRTARTYTYPIPGFQESFPGASSLIIPPRFPTGPPLLDVVSPGISYPIFPDLYSPSGIMYPPSGVYPPLFPFPSACSLRHNGTCHHYTYVMYGGCRDKRYTWEHCPRNQMCCYTEQAASPDPGTSSDPPPDPTTPADPPADCTYNGATYPSGDTFPHVDGCNTCQCTILGVMCTTNTC